MKLFKDLYKKANDSIPAEDAYANVMQRIERSSANTKHRRIGEIAALAACLIFTFATVSIYERQQEKLPAEEVQLIDTVDTAEATETGVPSTPEPEKAEAAPKKTEAAPTPAEKKSVKTPEYTPSAKQETENAATEKTAKADTDAASQTTAAAVDKFAPQEKRRTTKLNINEPAKSSGGGASAAALQISEDAQPTREVTLSEYYEYLGKNIVESIALPDGFENITQDAAVFTLNSENNFENDKWGFIFQNGEKSAEIVTTKHTETVQKYIDRGDYLKSTVCGIDAVVLNDGDFYKAHLVAGGIGYSVSTYGLTQSEVENLLVSLVQ